MKINKEAGSPRSEAGQASRMLLVLAIIIIVAVIIVYLVMKMATPAPKPVSSPTPIVPLPVYEKQLENVRFVFESAIDRGEVLKASDVINNQYDSSEKKDLPISNTGAKYIQVTVGAQDKGTENIEQGSWDIENIVDSQGRNFVPLDGYNVAPWLPSGNLCGALLKPAFNPSSCVKIYEVSKESTGLQIRVITGKNNTASNFSSGNTDSFLIDLIVK